MDYEEPPYFPSDTDLDFSFTSTATDRTFASSSARSSLARSSLTLSFNDRLSTTTITPTSTTTSFSSLHHRQTDPHWYSIRAASNLSSDGKLHLRHLKLLRHLGTGNLGRVFLCQLKDCSTATFALKVVDRDSLSKKKLSHVETEAEILSMLDHPFLPTLYARLDVSHYTCLLIDYCRNGDLHSLLRKQPGNRLPVHAVRFFAAEILVALEYLHAIGVVYRDLKPENIMLREDGHIMLSDFDLCFKADVIPMLNQTVNSVRNKRTRGNHFRRRRTKVVEHDVVTEFVAEPTDAFSNSCVGTHEYLAPELLSGNGHGNGVDWWAFGVLIYELLYGTTPFKGGSKETTLRNIASSRQVEFLESTGVETAEMEAVKDLITNLLVKDPRRRLGSAKGATDVKRHRFFDGIKWPLIRHYKPPHEVRGLVSHARKGKLSSSSHVTTVAAASPRRRWSWRWLRRSLVRRSSSRVNHILGSYSSNNCNSNSHLCKVRKRV